MSYRYVIIRPRNTRTYRKRIPDWFRQGEQEYEFAKMIAMTDTLGRIRRFRKELLWDYWRLWRGKRSGVRV